ncbi:MAG: aspartate aminotransferase family protein [Xanthomonadales bacterium]|nr:aspartate aminotransferase family protein [Xanthomonadales bacterium]
MSALLSGYKPFPFELDHASGDRLYDPSGQSWYDYYGGHCVASTGHCHPQVVAAIEQQARRLLFYSTAGEMSIRHRAADALAAFADGTGCSRVFFINSGAEANENALKLALKLSGRRKLVCFQGGWHGRSLLPLAVTDDPSIRGPFADLLPEVIALPWNDSEALENVPWSEVAAAILEPIQSMSGIRPAQAGFVQRLSQLCRGHGSFLIFDEVQTGVGRLGHPFGANWLGVQPDFITLAKGIASGVPMGAMLCSDAIGACLAPGDLGSTFGGGPLACAALLATLQVIADEDLVARAGSLGQRLMRELPGPWISRVRGAGLLLGLETTHEAARLRAHLYARHLLVGASSDPNVLRLMPPLTLTDEAVEALIEAVHSTGTG